MIRQASEKCRETHHSIIPLASAAATSCATPHKHTDTPWENYGDVSTNQAENYFSQLKRSLDGTHHHVSRRHLPRYLAEFDYRYSTRKMTDSARMADTLGRVGGKRLTYRETR